MKTWKLRILNSEHAGAEVSLSQAMILGSDEDAVDLVLDAAYVSPQCVRLLPEEDGVKLQLLDEAVLVRVQGEEWAEDTLAPLQCVIWLGDLALALREGSSEWASEIVTFSDAGVSAQAHNELPEAQHSPRSRHGIRAFAAQLARRKPLKYGGIGAVCMAAAWLIFAKPDTAEPSKAAANSLKHASVAQDPDNATHARLHQLLTTPDYSAVSISSSEASAHMYLSGYVADEVVLSRLQYHVEELGSSVDIQVYSIEQIERSARLVLANLGLAAQSIKEGEEAGTFVAEIDGDFMETWEAARRTLLADIQGLVAWEFDVKQTLSPLARLKQLTAKLGFENLLAYVDDRDKIKIIARLNTTQEAELAVAMAEFRFRVGDTPALEYVSPGASDGPLTLNDFGIAAVRVGIAPYVTHQNGQRYLQGARLPSGTILQDIVAGMVSFSRGEEQYNIRYEQHDITLTDVDHSVLLN